jgi:hypothetical protein
MPPNNSFQRTRVNVAKIYADFMLISRRKVHIVVMARR